MTHAVMYTVDTSAWRRSTMDIDIDIAQLMEWVGRTETRSDWLAPAPLAMWNAILDRDEPVPVAGTPLPALAHWVYFTAAHRSAELGDDGHPRRGGFLPPVALPLRMWAGGRVRF